MVDFDGQVVLGKRRNKVVLSADYEGRNGGDPYDQIAGESLRRGS